MKYLIMCEGPNELEIIKVLLRHDCLKFTKDDLLGLVPYHARQIKNSGIVQTALNMYPGEVIVILNCLCRAYENIVILGGLIVRMNII